MPDESPRPTRGERTPCCGGYWKGAIEGPWGICSECGERDDAFITVTVRRDDALVLVSGPLDAAIKGLQGSVLRLRQTVAKALADG